MEKNFRLTHHEVVKYVKVMLACFGITEYDFFEKAFETENEYYYGDHQNHIYSRFYGLPAPFGIGNIKIEVFDSALSFRFTMNQIKKLNKEEQEFYGTDILKLSDDIWFIDLKDFSLSDRIVDSRSGYNRGRYVDEKTILKFNELFNILFGKEYKTNYIVQVAAKSYAQNRETNNFIELAANAWNLHSDLWKCINKFSTQWGEISVIWLHNEFKNLKWHD